MNIYKNKFFNLGKRSVSRHKDESSSDTDSSDDEYIGGKTVDKKLKKGALKSAENPDWVFISDRQLATKRLGFHTKLQVGDIKITGGLFLLF